MNHDRIDWIDWAKTLCIFFMVCGHSNPFPLFHDFVYLFHMPVFFIITGILYKPKSIKQLINTLIVPTIIWNIINYPWYLTNIIGHKICSYEDFLIKPILGLVIHDFDTGTPICGSFWFVLVIFILRVTHPIINKLKNNSIYIYYFLLIYCLLFKSGSRKRYFIPTTKSDYCISIFSYRNIYQKTHDFIVNDKTMEYRSIFTFIYYTIFIQFLSRYIRLI